MHTTLSKYHFLFRILLDILIFSSVLLFPWWISVIIALFSLVLFDYFFEIIFLGILIDVLYYPSPAGISVYPYLFTIAAFVVAVAAPFIKQKLKFY